MIQKLCLETFDEEGAGGQMRRTESTEPAKVTQETHRAGLLFPFPQARSDNVIHGLVRANRGELRKHISYFAHAS